MALSNVAYLGDGSNKIFSVTFPYLSKTHVKVYVDSIEVTAFTWLTSSSISITTAPANLATVVLKRVTPTTPIVDFVDGSTLTESLLDTSSLQGLYVVEEGNDTLISALALDSTDAKYDADNKVIKNVGTPVSNKDAVTKEYVDAIVPSNIINTNAAAASAANAAASALEASLYDPSGKVDKTSSTGSAILPASTTANRDGTPLAGYIRFNTTLNQFEGYNGTAWGAIGGGATGGVGDSAFYLNDQTITADYTIPTGQNAMTAGDITIAEGVTVTIPTGSKWSIV